MTDQCRNDCLEPLLFPRRPNNRPGLPRIDYRIGAYGDIREALLRWLDGEPDLLAWTHRSADDPGIALLEGVAIMGDILTFYQDLYANEAYLPTAQWRESVADLVRLLGYRLSPGVGGRGTFAFEIKGDKPITIPRAFPITAHVEGLEKEADFETTSNATAYPWLSKFNLFRPLHTPYIETATKEFYIYSPDPFTDPVVIDKGDRLLIGDADDTSNPARLYNAEIVIIDSVREMHGRRLYKIKGSLKRTGSTFEISAFKLGRSFKHFGHQAPPQYTSIGSSGTASQQPIGYRRYLDQSTPPSPNVTPILIVDPPLGDLELALDGEVQDLATGVRLVVQGRFMSISGDVASGLEAHLVRTVTDVKARSMTWGHATGKVTIATVGSSMSFTDGESRHLLDVREAQIHEVTSPALRLRGGQAEMTAVSGTDLYFYGTEAQVQTLDQRSLLLLKADGSASAASVVAVQSLSPMVAERPLLRGVTLDHIVTYADFPNEKPTLTVYGNLVEAAQGKSEREAVLGNGDVRQVFQTFKLPKAPLTYLNSVGETPPEVPELQVYVNDRLWTRVPSLFAHGEREEIYIVREDVNGDSWVQFGDGKTGARVPSGLGNIVAKYRTGIGAYGALKADTIPQARKRLDKLDKIRLPDEVTGGAQPEAADKARDAAPGNVQSLGRLVALADFETETLAIPGVTKASAAWQLVDNVPAVVLTVLMDTGRESEIDAVRAILADYNRCRGPQRFPILVHQGFLRYVFLDLLVALDPTFREEIVIEAVKEALGLIGEEGNGVDGSKGLMATNRRRFGEREYATRLEATAQNVSGVLWCKANALGAMPLSADPTTVVPYAAPWPFSAVVACDDDRILALHKTHLSLLPAPAGAEKPC